MSNTRRVVFATLASLVLVAALWAMPPAPGNTQPTAVAQETAAQLSVSGKITAVAKDSFTLSVAGQTTQQLAQEAPQPKSMTFHIDKNTAIEGKLKVNANADVTYREQSGRNIAISVHVAS